MSRRLKLVSKGLNKGKNRKNQRVARQGPAVIQKLPTAGGANPSDGGGDVRLQNPVSVSSLAFVDTIPSLTGVSLPGKDRGNTGKTLQNTAGAKLLAGIPRLTLEKPQAKKPEEAERVTAAGVGATPQHSLRQKDLEQKFSRAVQLFQGGNLQESEAVCREILACAPNYAKALNQIGVIAYSVGNHNAAISYIKGAIASSPAEAGFYNCLGVVLSKLEKHAESLTCYRQAVQLDPSLAQAFYNMANALKEMGKVQQAIAAFEKSIQLKPDYAKAYNNLGVLLQGIGRTPDAIDCFKRALQTAPDLAETYKNLGNAYVAQGEISKAEECFSAALQLRPGYSCAIAGQAGILEKQGRADEAYQLMKPVIEGGDLTSDNAAATFARLSGSAGKREEAEAYLRKMLEHGSFHVDARTNLLFSLGDLNDKLGRFDAAFEYYRQGNELKPYRYDRSATVRQFDDLIANFSSGKMAAFPKAFMPETVPLFILGMPRSGTTLVEQILASHPLVFGAGELETMKQLVEKLPATTNSSGPYPFCLDALRQENLQALADEFMRQVLALSAGAQVARITDKMPHNFQHIGLIRLLFPESPIIHCVRDPMDTCLSIYFHDFAGRHPYAYDLESLGHYYRQYQRLMAHWREVLQVPMFEVRYEEMVADQERVSRALVDFCGLGWDERCLRFHKTERLVNTASYQQVRKPIYKSSAGRWRNYERYLRPLQEALEKDPEWAKSAGE